MNFILCKLKIVFVVDFFWRGNGNARWRRFGRGGGVVKTTCKIETGADPGFGEGNVRGSHAASHVAPLRTARLALPLTMPMTSNKLTNASKNRIYPHTIYDGRSL